MIIRIVALVGLALPLSACADWNYARPYGPYGSARGTTGVYDQADQYEDAQGFPLPGFEYMKYPTSGSL